MNKDELLVEAHYYAREQTANLAFMKGFPLSESQIMGFLEIYKAYSSAADVIRATDGDDTNPSDYLDLAIRDFMDFVESDIPPNETVFERVVTEYYENRFVAIYTLKHGLTECREIAETEDKIKRLIENNQWEELYKIAESDEKCLEI